jgi:hypothetical protein
MIGAIIFAVILLTVPFAMPKLWWCKMGLHKWEYPGGPCEDCGKEDDFWTPR